MSSTILSNLKSSTYDAKWGDIGKRRVKFYHQALPWSRRVIIYAPAMTALLSFHLYKSMKAPLSLNCVCSNWSLFICLFIFQWVKNQASKQKIVIIKNDEIKGRYLSARFTQRIMGYFVLFCFIIDIWQIYFQTLETAFVFPWEKTYIV